MKNVLFGLISLILLVGVASAGTNYYYADIEIFNNPGIENYQTYTLIDHRDGMNSDFSNIRMYNSAGLEVPYYIESYTEGVSAKVWYQIDSNDTKMQVRWGIEGETVSESNPSTVYDFYDGLEDGTVSKWDVKQGYGTAGIMTDIVYTGAHSIGSNQVGTQGGGSAAYDQNHAFIKIPLSDFSVGESKWINCTAKRWKTTTWQGNFCGFGIGSTQELFDISYDDTWRKYSTLVTRNSETSWTYELYIDNIFSTNSTQTKTYTDYFLYGIQTRKSTASDNTMYFRMDDAIAKKYAAIEPTTSVGVTQTNASSDIPENSFLSALSGNDFDLLGLMVSPYTSIMGSYFWALVGLVPVFMMYIKSQDLALPLICGLLFTAAFGFSFPQNLGVALIMLLGTGIGAMLFKTFKGAGN